MEELPKLKTLRLCVADVEKSRHFYEHLFGAAPVEECADFVRFDFSGAGFELVKADDKNPCSTGGSVGYFEVGNLKDVIADARSAGGTIWRGPLKISEDGRHILQIKDTEGNVIGFEGHLAAGDV